MKRFLAIIAVFGAIGFVVGRGTSAEPKTERWQPAVACPESAGVVTRIAPRATSPSPGASRASSPVDPTSARYDATVAARILSRSPSELWEREPRDEAFAGRREQFMRGRFVELLAQLVPGASLDHVECRRGTCLLDVSAATDDAAQLDGALSFIPFGDRFETESTELESGRTTIRVHVSFTREHVDAVEFETWFEHWWEERWRLARERYDRDHAAPVDGGAR